MSRGIVIVGFVIVSILVVLGALPKTISRNQEELTRRSALSRWVQREEWKVGAITRAADPAVGAVGSGGEDGTTQGWERHVRIEGAVLVREIPGHTDSIIPQVAAKLRAFVASDSGRAEALRWVEFQQGKDVLRMRYQTRYRVGDLFVWTVPERLKRPIYDGSHRAIGELEWNRSVNVLLTEFPGAPE